MLIDKPPKKMIDEFISLCYKVDPATDVKNLRKVTIDTVKFYTGNKEARGKNNKNRQMELLEENWYKSVDSGNPDYHKIYGAEQYLSEAWACWVIYSRGYLRAIDNKKSLFGKSIVEDLKDITSVADLGCGLGYTTAGLKQLFPDAKVAGTNLEDTSQYRFAELLGNKYDFKMYPNVNSFDGEANLIVAFEYFEHFEEPVAHAKEIIDILNPKAILAANSFNTKSLGHFDVYKVNGENIPAKNISKTFNNFLIEYGGFKKVKTGLWNNRPNYWKR